MLAEFEILQNDEKGRQNLEILKPLEALCEPDPRQGSWVVVVRDTGEARRRTIADIYETVATARITASNVPETVHSLFAVTQNLIVYSWFVYAFAATAEFQAAATLELALRLRIDPRREHERWGLQRFFDEALSKRLIVDEGLIDLILPAEGTPERLEFDSKRNAEGWDDQQYARRVAKSFSHIRNRLAHGNFMLIKEQVLTLHLVARIVDQLYKAK
jgi:hypothetical protein